MTACRLSILIVCSVLWPAILLGAEQPSAPRTGDLSGAIDQLGSPDFEKREEAAKKIQAAGLGALAELKAALSKTGDEEVKERLKAIVRNIQAANPELLLKITLEGPLKALRLEGDGEVALKVWFENMGDTPVVVCQPVDGSFDLERNPKYRFALLNADGRGYAESRFGRCGNVNALRKDDFATIQPGEKVDLFERAKGWGRFCLKNYVGLKPGPHTLTLTYTMTSEDKAGGIPLGGNAPEVAGLREKAVKGAFISAPLKLNIAPPMTTEDLLAILNGKASDELSLREAILAVRDRKEPKAVEPLCKLLEHRDPQARQWAAFALGSFPDASKVEPLLKACRDEDDRVRQRALEAVSSVKDKRVVTALVAGLGDTDSSIRQTAYSQLMYERGLQPHVNKTESFNYNPFSKPEQQAGAIAAWKKWWAQAQERFEFRKEEQPASERP